MGVEQDNPPIYVWCLKHDLMGIYFKCQVSYINGDFPWDLMVNISPISLGCMIHIYIERANVSNKSNYITMQLHYTTYSFLGVNQQVNQFIEPISFLQPINVDRSFSPPMEQFRDGGSPVSTFRESTMDLFWGAANPRWYCVKYYIYTYIFQFYYII